MRITKSLAPALLAPVLLFTASARATLISYDVANVGGHRWEYTYTVANDTLAVGIEELTVFFDAALFDHLAAAATPADWDPLVIDPDLGLPADGFYDALSLSGGIAPGGLLGGFAVRFDFLGTGAPGAQLFQVFDPLTFEVLDFGVTTPRVAAAVPEPGAMALLAFGLTMLLALRARMSRDRRRRSAARGRA